MILRSSDSVFGLFDGSFSSSSASSSSAICTSVQVWRDAWNTQENQQACYSTQVFKRVYSCSVLVCIFKKREKQKQVRRQHVDDALADVVLLCAEALTGLDEQRLYLAYTVLRLSVEEP